MKPLAWLSGDPVSTERIVLVERRIGYRFPDAFREIVRRHDGARPSRDYVTFPNADIERGTVGFRYLHPVAHRPEIPDLLTLLGIVKEWIPRGIVPFAAQDCADHFCFDFRRGENPAVVYWSRVAGHKHFLDYDRSSVEFLDEECFLIPLAPSFESFLEMLREPTAEELEEMRRAMETPAAASFPGPMLLGGGKKRRRKRR